MDSQFTNFTPLPRQSSHKARAFLYVGLFLLLIGLVIFLGNRFLSSSGKKGGTVVPTSTPVPTHTPTVTTPTATATPSATASPTPKASSLKIEVLNGSGVKGAAGDAASTLESAGYTVSSTGNADTFDYTQTVIQLKKSKTSFGAGLKRELSADYSVNPTIQTLAESSPFDAIVIVGSK